MRSLFQVSWFDGSWTGLMVLGCEVLDLGLASNFQISPTHTVLTTDMLVYDVKEER